MEIFLTRIKIIKTPKCWWYGEAKQSVKHLYLNIKDGKKRDKTVKELYIEGIRSQA